MKKILLLFLLIVSSVTFVFSQNPCIQDYQIGNGGGSCPDMNGTSATGTVTLSFNGVINPLVVPTIAFVTDITDPLNPQVVADVTFGPGTLMNNGDVKYCYYVGPANNNNLGGRNSVFRFVVSYSGSPCSGEEGVLPVSFRAFTASRNNSAVALKWTTAMESNNLGFEIQRLVGTGTWQSISFISSQANNGNSSSDLTYAFTDQNSSKGISQYRIRQVDIDGRSKLSEIRVVRGYGQKGKTIVYPNPSSDGKVSILFDDLSGIRDISLMDLSGRVIKQMKGVTNNNIQIDNLAPGFYTVRIVNTETSEQVVEKFIVNKR
jgi:hypothetical protein